MRHLDYAGVRVSPNKKGHTSMAGREPSAEEWDREITGNWEGNPNWRRDSDPEYQIMVAYEKQMRDEDKLAAVDQADAFRWHYEYGSYDNGICLNCGEVLPVLADQEDRDPTSPPRSCVACEADIEAGRFKRSAMFEKWVGCQQCSELVLVPREQRATRKRSEPVFCPECIKQVSQ